MTPGLADKQFQFRDTDAARVQKLNLVLQHLIAVEAVTLDETIAALASLTGATDQIAYFTGADTMGLTGLTAFARSILDDADAGTVRTTIGAAAAAHTHALADVTGLTDALGAKLDDSQATAFSLSLLDDATAADARGTLGLGALALVSSINDGLWSGADLSIANGGTGASTAATARANLSIIASNIPSVATGGLAATTVQAALAELDTEKAPKASPEFTDLVQVSGPVGEYRLVSRSVGGGWSLYNPNGEFRIYDGVNAADRVVVNSAGLAVNGLARGFSLFANGNSPATSATGIHFAYAFGIGYVSCASFNAAGGVVGYSPIILNGTLTITNAVGVAVTGEARSDSLRLDVAATAGTVAATHTIPVNINGTAGRILVAVP